MSYTQYIIENEQAGKEPILRIWRELKMREEQDDSQENQIPQEENDTDDSSIH